MTYPYVLPQLNPIEPNRTLIIILNTDSDVNII